MIHEKKHIVWCCGVFLLLLGVVLSMSAHPLVQEDKKGLFLSWGTSTVADSVMKTNPERLAYPTAIAEDLPGIRCDGELEEIGLFSVSGTRKVAFSPGNLQWSAQGTHRCADGTVHPGTWRFAPNQWEVIGEEGNYKIDEDYAGWIDLFGWGTSDWSGSGVLSYHPWSTNYYLGGWTSDNKITGMSGDYKWCDWGQYNDIENVWGTDSAGTWYTLSQSQWTYLFTGRRNAEQLYGRGQVEGITGVVLLPDDWTVPVGQHFVSGEESQWDDNRYSKREWREMESKGAVFLPWGGVRGTLSSSSVYRSSTARVSSNECSSWCIAFDVSHIPNGSYNSATMFGYSVRLVRDKERNRVFPIGGGRYIRFAPGNLQYSSDGSHLCADGTTQKGRWRFAEHQWDYVGDAENGNVFDSNGEKCNNDLRGESYSGWIDQFSWGTSGYNGKTPWLTSNNNEDFVWGLVNGEAVHGDIDTTYYDWGAYNQIGDDPPGTWHTITMAQFDALTRANSLQGLATVNGVEGHVFLPDEWELPEGLSWTGLPKTYDVNVYTLEEWGRMEANGAVFFPKTHNFAPTNPNIDIFGCYWTATGAVAGNNNPVTTSAVYIFFSPYYYNINRNNTYRSVKRCVRLMQYVK